MRWEDLREEEFQDAVVRSGGLCVIPIGCTEVHGQHLPLGTDYFQARAFAEAAAEKEEVVIFPTGFWLGDVGGTHAIKNPAEAGKSGYISISPQLQMLALTEICGEIARNGFRKILILNYHGGNVAMLDYFLRAYAYEQTRDHAVMVAFGGSPKALNPALFYETVMADRQRFSYLTEEDLAVMKRFAETGTGGGHGDYNESVAMKYIRPDITRIDRCTATSGTSTHRADYLREKGIKAQFAWPSNFPNSFDGYDPIGASENIGRAFVELSAEHLAGIFKMLKEDEDCVRMAQRLPRL